MDTPETSQEKPQGQEHDRIRYVEELENQDDYWLSLTDAARICRVQDVSIRRAINAGRLPVRRAPAGDNRRTRFVRASDLPRANFPILDSGAAITSDIRKVDILNIPLQQQRLAEQQEAQAADFARLREESARITEQFTAIQQDQVAATGQIVEMQEAQRIQSERYHQDHIVSQEQAKQTHTALDELSTGQQAAMARIDELLTTSQEQQKQLTLLLTRIEAQDQQYMQMATRFDELQKDTSYQLERMQLSMQEQLQQGMKGVQAEFKAALAVTQKEMQALIEQQSRDLSAAIQSAEQDEARDIAAMTAQQEQQSERVEWLTARLTSVAMTAQEAKRTAEGDQSRISRTERDVTNLEQQLQAEQSARATLADRLAKYEAQNSAELSKKPNSGKRN